MLVGDFRVNREHSRSGINLFDRPASLHGVTDKDGMGEVDALGQIERAVSRDLHADKRGQQACMQKPVYDPLLKFGARCKLVVGVQRVIVTRQLGKGGNIRRRDGPTDTI